MTYIWYTNNIEHGYTEMNNQIDENNDGILEWISNDRGWIHFESKVNDYITMDSERYAHDLWSIVTKSPKPVYLTVDSQAYETIKLRLANLRFTDKEVALLAF